MTDNLASSTTTPIPLNKLFVSEDNVRKTATAEGITELAASIKAHGLQHNLVVKADGKKFGIIDGSRRYKALLQLVEAGHISDNLPVPCKIDESKIDGKELSLAANIMREAMHTADEFEAFLAMSEKGATDAEIAARFGCAVRHVTQLLKMARCSPYALKLYRAGEITLDIIMALTLTDDHERQDKLLKEAPAWWTAREFRKALTEDKLPVTDKLVKYVTLKACQAAGVQMLDDLFVDFGQGGYIIDVPKVKELATEKLIRAAKLVEKEGWKWTLVTLDTRDVDTSKLKRIFPEQAELTAAEQKKLDKLHAEREKLEQKWDDQARDSDSDEPVAAPKGLDKLQEQIGEIEDRDGVWTPEQISTAGAIITIGNDGKVEIERGLVRPEDMPATKGKSKKAASSKADDAEAQKDSGLSASLVESLTEEKSAATAAALLQDMPAALAEVVYSLVLAVYHEYGIKSCLTISAGSQRRDTVEGTVAHGLIEDARKLWGKKLPKDAEKIRAWLLKQDRKTLLELLAFCAAATVNAVQRKSDRPDDARLEHAGRLAKDLGFSMTSYFKPTADNYFSKVSRSQILADIAEAKGQPYAPALEKLKKGDLAKEAEKLVQGTSWLPKPLRFDAEKGASKA